QGHAARRISRFAVSASYSRRRRIMERTEAPAAAAARMEAVKVQQEGLDRRQTEQQEALDRRHKEQQGITVELAAKARRMNARGAAIQAAAAVHAGGENRMFA